MYLCFLFLLTIGVDIFKQKLCDAIKQAPQIRITVEQQADIENLRNLMFVRSEQSLIEGFDNTDIDCIGIIHNRALITYCFLLSIPLCIFIVF